MNKTPFYILGPCVIESKENTLRIAEYVKHLQQKYQVPCYFKASFSKENRTSGSSYRGEGETPARRLANGIEIMREVKARFGLRTLTDVHTTDDIREIAQTNAIDAIQIPAMLCRQTELLEEAAKSGLLINIKKSQSLPAASMKYAVEKITTINPHAVVAVTERGSSFGGSGDLVVDLRNVMKLKKIGTTIFDATHSVQTMSTSDGKSGGNRELAIPLARAVATLGVDGFFAEIHFDPDKALSDGPNSLTFEMADRFIKETLEISKL